MISLLYCLCLVDISSVVERELFLIGNALLTFSSVINTIDKAVIDIKVNMFVYGIII
jgi:hypothetical protein